MDNTDTTLVVKKVRNVPKTYKKNPKVVKQNNVNFKIHPNLEAALDHTCITRGLSRANVIRAALKEYLGINDLSVPFDPAKLKGFTPSVEDTIATGCKLLSRDSGGYSTKQ